MLICEIWAMMIKRMKLWSRWTWLCWPINCLQMIAIIVVLNNMSSISVVFVGVSVIGNSICFHHRHISSAEDTVQPACLIHDKLIWIECYEFFCFFKLRGSHSWHCANAKSMIQQPTLHLDHKIQSFINSFKKHK